MDIKKEILIIWKDKSVKGILNSSPTAEKLWETLPVKSLAQRWGDEIYFNVPIKATLENNATDVVPPGTICFWVEGNSVAIPFGKTPISRGNECRLITAVNILGTISDSPNTLSSISEGMQIEIRKFKE